MDISLCRNNKCKLRLRCFRFLYKSNHPWQSYQDFEPNKDGTCDSFKPAVSKENKGNGK